jgi:regulator of sirC expression with transglutaminase-like and TPR domain
MRRLTGLLLLICAACAPAPPNPALNVTTLLDEGRAHLAVYEWDRAIDAFARAVAIAPDHAEAYCLRGLAYASAPGGPESRGAAIEDYTRCLALAPQGPYANDARRALAALSTAATAASPSR